MPPPPAINPPSSSAFVSNGHGASPFVNPFSPNRSQFASALKSPIRDGHPDLRRASIQALREKRQSVVPTPLTISEERRASLAVEAPVQISRDMRADGQEACSPPFTLHDTILSRLDPEYVEWYNEFLIDHQFMVNTHHFDPKLLRKGGKVVPGPSPPLALPTQDFDVVGRDDNPAVPVRVWWPSAGKDAAPEGGWPLFIWAHGGGWILGSKNTENNFTTRMAEGAQCVVVSVGYRLAPENPYPDCLEDFWDVINWAAFSEEGVKALNINPDRLAIGGSSAGGNIASVISHQYAADDSLPPLKLQMLLVPVIDNTASKETHLSWRENEFTPQLPAEKMMTYRRYYLQHESLWTQPEASPIFFEDESFRRLPKAVVVAAELDVLRTEDELYHEKMRRNGVDSKLYIYPKVPHHTMGLCLVLEQGRKLTNDCAAELKDAFYGTRDICELY